jgi:hypothetical protein
VVCADSFNNGNFSTTYGIPRQNIQVLIMINFILFGTSGCHLCDEAEFILAEFKHLGIETVDIAEHEEWQEKYAIRIPVLYHPETKRELGWPFSQQQVQLFTKE